jgi:hypothetical protein
LKNILIKDLIKNKETINLILRHLVFKLKQINFAQDSLKKRSHKLQEEIEIYLEKKKSFSLFIASFYKGDYEELSGYYLPHNCGQMFFGPKQKESYIGQFNNGLFEGLGIRRFNDKEKYLEKQLLPIIYDGEWLANEYHGFGHLLCKSKEADVEEIEDTFGNFYFGKLYGFGKKYCSKKCLGKNGTAYSKELPLSLTTAIFGYFKFDRIINFFLFLDFENELNIANKSGLYFLNKDGKNILLHQLISNNEISNLMDSVSIRDEKLPSVIENYYKDYFDDEFKSDKFKELYIKIATGIKIFQIELVKSKIKKNIKKFIKTSKELETQLLQSTKINELEKIDQNLKNCFNEKNN